jgi:glycosyltransferase involved in cell wall biosynthesis
VRIALVNQPWGFITPPVNTGGSIPILLYQIAIRLARSSEVFFYTRGTFRKRQIIDQNITYRYLPMAVDKLAMKLMGKFGRFPDYRKPLFANRWAYRWYGQQLAMDLRQQRCDVAMIVNMSQFVPIVRRHNPNILIILQMHCEWLNQLDHETMRKRLRHCDLIAGVSDFITQKAKACFPEFADRFVTIYDGVNVDDFASKWTAGRPKPSGDEQRIVFVGRITPEKGVHTLIEAFNRIADRFPRARLEIVGPDEINPPALVVPFSNDPKVFELVPLFEVGAYRALVEKLAAVNRNRITFAGNLPHSVSLVGKYQSGDVCVTPSIWEEPFGMPVVEAMSAGSPVIATRGGAFPELIQQDQTGLLVERGNPQELADALAKFLADPAMCERMGRASRERAVEMFSWDRIADDFVKLCQQRIGRRIRQVSVPA